MKKFTIMLASVAVAAAAMPAIATAAPAPDYGFSYQGGGAWQNINARQNRIENRINQGIRSGALTRREATQLRYQFRTIANLEARINQGIRSGALTRREAVQLRAQFRGIANLEARYRASRPGLTMAERRDLDRRFDALERSIRIQKNDRDDRGRDHRGPHRR